MLKKLGDFLNWQFIRFVLTGILNTIVGYLLYVVGYYITGNETVALVLDYTLSILFNFKSYSLLVFKNKDNSKIFRFVGVYLVVFLLNRVSLWIYIDVAKIDPYLSQLIALLYIPIIMFGAFKKYVFNQ